MELPSPSEYTELPGPAVERCATRILSQLRQDAQLLNSSPLTAPLAEDLAHSSLPAVLSAVLVRKLCATHYPKGGPNAVYPDERSLHATFTAALSTPALLRAVVSDLAKIVAIDPAVDSLLQPFLFFKGFHALAVHRVANALWSTRGGSEKLQALMLQSRVS